MSTFLHERLRSTHVALNNLLAQMLVSYPDLRELNIYETCLLELARNRGTWPDAPLSGNFYQEAEALHRQEMERQKEGQ